MKEENSIKSDKWLNFAEGYAACVEAAFHADYGVEECPYEVGSKEEECWKNGWEKAQEIIR